MRGGPTTTGQGEHLPHKRVLPPTREPGLWAGDAPRASQAPEADPTQERSRGNRRAPPAPGTTVRRPECEPIPVPHAGEDAPHNECADRFPPNRYPGMDVLVGGKRFDALQVGVRVLWEIKTHQPEACGYGFVVGVSCAAHKAALEAQDRLLNIVVTGCKR
jgi:hypothetical protein